MVPGTRKSKLNARLWRNLYSANTAMFRVTNVRTPASTCRAGCTLLSEIARLTSSGVVVVDSSTIALYAAHQQLQRAAIAGDAARFSTRVAEEYLRLVRNGSWFAPLRPALDAFVDKIQERVSGVVRLKLFKGECAIVDCQVAADPAGTATTQGGVRHHLKLTTISDTSTTSRLTTDD